MSDYKIGNLCPATDPWGRARNAHVPFVCYDEVEKSVVQRTSTIGVVMKICKNCGSMYAEIKDKSPVMEF